MTNDYDRKLCLKKIAVMPTGGMQPGKMPTRQMLTGGMPIGGKADCEKCGLGEMLAG